MNVRPNRYAPLMVLAAGALMTGCRSYEAKPLDAAAHRAAFLTRTPASAEVAAFAERLSGTRTGTASFDPSDGLTLAEAEVVSLVFNRDVRVARLEAGVAQAHSKAAGLWEDPVLGTDFTRILESTEHPWKAFGSVSFTIPISGRLEVAKKLAAQQYHAALMRAWAQEWTLRSEVRRQWVAWSSARERETVMREFLARLDDIVGIVDAVAEAGEMTRIEARVFKLERATRAAELAAIAAQVHHDEIRLKSLLGLPPEAAVSLTASLAWRNGTSEDLSSFTQGPERNTDVVISQAEYTVAERTLELEIRKQYPDLTIGPGYGREDGQDQFLLGLSVPLPIFNGNRQGIMAALAEREHSRGEYERTLERLAEERTDAALAHQTARLQREAFEREVVPLVDEQYRDARRIAELGEVNTLLLLDTLTRQQEAKVRLIEAQAEESLASIRVVELNGPADEPVATDTHEGGAHP